MTVAVVHLVADPTGDLATRWADRFPPDVGSAVELDWIESRGPAGLPEDLRELALATLAQVAVGVGLFDGYAEAQAGEAALRAFWAELSGAEVDSGSLVPFWTRDGSPEYPSARMIWRQPKPTPDPVPPALEELA